MSSKSWVYTLNNYTDADIEQLKLLEVNRHRCCKEVGESGTPHLQGSITFKRTYRFKQLTKLFPKVHWEVSKAKDSVNYCIKGEVIIDTKESEQGKRNDLKAIGDQLKGGKGIREIASEFPEAFIKYHKGIKALQEELAPRTETYKKLEVIVIIGTPGCGKTRRAWEYDPMLYSVPEPINHSLWFDGYVGQRTILLDDFYGWVKYHTLLQLLDGYPMQLPKKGGFVSKNWEVVFITSNKPIEDWYNREEIEALKRRITRIELLNN